MKRRAVIVGTGALGLGFLAERLASDYDLCLADVQAKQHLLSRIQASQGFTLNLCGPNGVHPRRVTGTFTTIITDTREGPRELCHALNEADLVLTAVRRRALDKVVPVISPGLNARENPVWLLFCENGLHIAVAYASRFGPKVVPVDTVMSRMCRFSSSSEEHYEPMWPGCDDRLVVEEYGYLPLDEELCSRGPFSPIFSLVSHDQFLLWEDIKLFLHNGMHAFVAYRAHIEGIRSFPDTPSRIRSEAFQVMLEEVIPAIVRTHRTIADQEEIVAYGRKLLKRFFNPFFNDSIERGVRGVEDKLRPGERLLGGCEYISRAGIEPVGYSGTVEAGKEILARRGTG